MKHINKKVTGGGATLLNKGFTLIELLAVIVILAIISLIATPIIMNVIESTREAALRRSADNYADTAEIFIAQTLLDNKITVEDGSYSITENGNLCVGIYENNSCSGKEVIIDINGTIPTGGWVAIQNGEVVWYDLIMNDQNVPMKSYTSDKCFTFDKNTGVISEYLCDDKEVIIPSEIDGVNVTDIDNTFFKTKAINIVLPNTITSIDYSAFASSQLESVIIPNSVTYIGTYAFTSCKLKNIVLPYGKVEFSLETFNNNLLPDDQAFIYARNEDGSIDKTTIVSYGGANKNVVIPDGVKVLYRCSFSNNKLTSVVIPNSVIDIQLSTFNNNLLPNDQAFIYARNEDGSIDKTAIVSYGGANKNPEIPYGIEHIQAYSFAGNLIESVKIPSTVKQISQYAFQKNKLTSIEIPSSVTTIETNAFVNNNDLTTIYYKGGASGFPWGATNATLVTD